LIHKFINIIFFIALYFSAIFLNAQNHSFEDGVIFLSNYMASDNFKNLDSKDIYLVDSLYLKADKFYNGNTSEALLALTFATLPFNKMPVTIPFLNIKLNLKLPSVKAEIFKKKKKNLPGIIYFDSPKLGGQDKDKIAHFFGNAFLKYNIRIINISKFFGIFVEMFESAFKVSGGVDYRDLTTNYIGEFFGYSLRKNKDIKPSDFFKLYSLFYFSYN